MAPLITLVAASILFRLTGFCGVEYLDSWQHALRGGLSAMFALTGIVHFVPSFRAAMIDMVPPRLPSPANLVTITGVLELAGAIGLWIPATAGIAAVCLAVLLLAMFPANISAARRHVTLPATPVTPLGIRTLIQLVYMAAAIAAV